MQIIKADTFIATPVNELTGHDVELNTKYGWDFGTVEVELNGETKRVKATNYGDGEYSAGGFVAKYRTGTKLWNASVTLRNGKETFSSGFDSRSGRHQIAPQIWFYDEAKHADLMSKR